MKDQKLKDVVEFAKRAGHLFIATVGSDEKPHIAAAGKLELISDGSVGVTEWFCPGTMENLQNNKHVSIVAWKQKPDNGFQLLGRVTKIEDIAILDGYAPEFETRKPLPQVEKRLVIKVEKMLEFKLGPHSDIEE